jgi:hypothetical protein
LMLTSRVMSFIFIFWIVAVCILDVLTSSWHCVLAEAGSTCVILILLIYYTFIEIFFLIHLLSRILMR